MKRYMRAVALLMLVPVTLSAQGASGFPHERHAKLFPVCSGCHAGIASGDAAASFPETKLCAACHDGTVQPRVAWVAPPSRGAGLLVFSHPRHALAAKQLDCASCHATSDGTSWMHVTRAEPTRCTGCHAHGTSAHLADANVCSRCHRPLAQAEGLTVARIASFPTPPSHAQSDFVSAHGAVARASGASCAVCHARESCQRCHVDGARQTTIRALAPDPRVARLVSGKAAVYPTPADHRNGRFVLLHGEAARANVARCATCHARSSCETCHTGQGARDVIRRLPDAREATAPGVQFRRPLTVGATPQHWSVSLAGNAFASPQQIVHRDTTPRIVRVHPPGFARAHGAQAASGAAQCASCHAQRFCSDCHAAERVSRRYHPANFVSTHAPQAYSRETDCSSCHSTEAFCRDCHRQTGLAATTNTRSTVFHNAQRSWLLEHGRAARQDLKSCTTCHQQTYCMQCHSDLGARISPHGPRFDAARMSGKNPRVCLYCHFTNPLAR